MRHLKLFCFLVFSISIANAELSPSFKKFITKNYGAGIEAQLSRRDIGVHGSYGGGEHNGSKKTRKQAAILVHGITNTAGTFNGHRMHMFNVGWSAELVYATTYGDGGKTIAPMVDMKCQYVKQVRYLIQVVAAFTRRKVDVIGYSLGSPISRKAIMGGKCVDTGEDLGPPLTPLIDTFLSIAGANRGSFLCALPFPGACNAVNGLSCNSRFIQDINSRQRYEGKYIFSIYGQQDDKVGFRNACGQLTSQIPGSNQEFSRPGNHDDIIIKTAQMQFNLIDKHKP